MFNEMLKQSLFLAVKKGKRPGAGDFEEKLTNLTKEIMETKIELLGNYLKKWFF